MKKAVALILAILMVATLFACKSSDDPKDPASPSVDNSSAAPSASDSASTPPTTPPPSVGKADEFNSVLVDYGYTTDPFSRDTYKLAYIGLHMSPYAAAMIEQWKLLGEKLNYEFSSFEASGDETKFMSIIETAAGQGYNGLIIEGNTTNCERIMEIMAEYPDVSYMPGFSPFDDANKHYLRPSVVVDSFNRGYAAMKFAIDNFHEYVSEDIAMEDVGFVSLNFSVITDFPVRVAGAVAAYEEAFPELMATNYLPVDTVAETTPISAEAAYNQLTPVIASNKQFKGWIVYACIEDYGDGGSRAIETAGLDDVSVVVSDSAAMLMRKWEAGYEGSWIAGADNPQVQWADGIACGLLQMIEGTKTPEELWANMREPGQDYTVIKLPYTTVNKENRDGYGVFVNTYLDSQYPG